MDPIDPVPWFNKGVAFNNLRRYKEAVICYDKVIEIDKNLAGAWHNKGISLANLGRYKEAIESYDQSLAINPENAETLYEKAISLSNLGRNRDAEKLVNKVRKMGLNV